MYGFQTCMHTTFAQELTYVYAGGNSVLPVMLAQKHLVMVNPI